MKSINNINQLNKSDFLSVFGNIFEKTEWIAEKVFDLKPFKSNDDLFSKMVCQYESCNKEQILIILNSHPELAVEKKLTKDSSNEQSGASLNECTFDEFEEFKKLNIEYRIKFGFPFIIAVKGKNKNDILNDFKKRIQNDLNSEFDEAKKQVMKIASFRFKDIVSI